MDEQIELLKKILVNQEIQLQQQKEALDNQAKALAMQSVQFDRAEGINKKSEKIQNKAMQIQKFASRLLFILVPVLLVALAMLIM